MSELAPIVLFVYNRPEHTQRTVEALRRNELAAESELIIFADGAKGEGDQTSVAAVRELIQNIEGFKKVTVHASPQNRGLANSVISGVTQVVEQYGKIIVLEDDMVTAPYFLTFMNEALERFKDDERIAQIHAFAYPSKIADCSCFLRCGANCWGWATWVRGWKLFRSDAGALYRELKQKHLRRQFDIEGAFPFSKMLRDQSLGKIDSWAIRFNASCFLADKYTLQSNVQLLDNIGEDGSGRHCLKQQNYAITLYRKPLVWPRGVIPLENAALRREYRHFLRLDNIPFRQRVKIKLSLIFQNFLQRFK